MRNIDHILHFRSDISPFLVHLTRTMQDGNSAKEALSSILETKSLICGQTIVSDARFGMYTGDMSEEQKHRLFSAICFTETPLSEVHCLLEIAYRNITLEPYGLVFLKERLASRGVAPVLYLNNETEDKDQVFYALCSLKGNHLNEAEQLLPLIAVFGKKIKAPGASVRPQGRVDFRWEREWRYPFVKAPFVFTAEDVFVGLCPHDCIDEFEALFNPVGFIDPTRNMKWYATKLIQARQRLDIKFSVV
ncbi:MAG: hypothetical protein MUP17_01220 [candidate division Zixibacteria bacterium]|nr:hypothetical protein [candidate division Zixibacteria bacterium]